MQLLKLDQVGSVLVNDRIERQPIAPGSREVTNVHVVVASGLHLTPEEQSVLGGFRLFVVGFFDCDVLNLQRMDGLRLVGFLAICN